MRLAEPLWLLALLPVWAALAWRLRRRGVRDPALPHPATHEMVRRGLARGRGWSRLPDVLRAAAMTLLVVAMARPQSTLSSETVRTEGIDIVMALDVSTSMLAEDLEPNRLEAAKEVAVRFVEGRPNDRIGLVIFAGRAYTQVPLTIDHRVVTEMISGLEAGSIEDGTAVGMGLATAVKRLEGSDAASKVVILLTDGRNNAGEIGPVTAARAAAALGVRVYTIGVGSRRGTARVPVDDPLRGRVYATIRVDVDEATLREVAQITGGRYFRATDNESLAAIYQEIDRLEKSEIEVEHFTRYEELFPPLVWAGLAILMLEVVLARTVLRRLP